MSLSTCEKCGGHVSLGPDASNCCEECGAHVFAVEPSNFMAKTGPGTYSGAMQDLINKQDAEIAALKARKVELPAKLVDESGKPTWGDYKAGYNTAIEACRRAIRAAEIEVSDG
jgi:hypothetical protein